MNNLKGFYDQYPGDATEWKTDITDLLNDVEGMINYKFGNLDIVTRVGLFLDKEEKELKEYIENLVIHYTYKRIFNKANKYFKNNKKKYLEDEIQFKEEFQNFLKKEFDINDYKNFKKFTSRLLDAILSNECLNKSKIVMGRPQTKENMAMRKFAKAQKRNNCYLCGCETKLEKEKDNINFYQWYLEKETTFTKNLYKNFNNIIDKHNQQITNSVINEINKNRTLKGDLYYHFAKKFNKVSKLISKKLKIKNNKLFLKLNSSTEKITFNNLNDKIIEQLFGRIILNDFNKEFKYAYAYYNNKIMKIEHCISVDWGGGKNEENLLISCHKCNQKKSNTVFFTEFSINKFFINEFEVEKAEKAFTGILGDEALISLKIKQNFECSDCEKKLSSFGSFYLRRINEEDGYHYLNTLITCKSCLLKLNKLDNNEFLNEFIKIKE